jgi:2-amino-4-hydroxy-6-hydroxymethyldihydropteridine diphosphokinase
VTGPGEGAANPAASPEVDVAIALGASLGDRGRTLHLAVAALRPLGVALDPSRIILTPPVGGVAHQGFYNAVVRMRTRLPPLDLLARLRAIELRLGRRPTRRWADRVIDLDLLLHGDTVRAEEPLILPHPRLHERRFVLQPLLEVWPDARDPRTGAAYAPLLRGAPHPVVGVLPRLHRAQARCTPGPLPELT